MPHVEQPILAAGICVERAFKPATSAFVPTFSNLLRASPITAPRVSAGDPSLAVWITGNRYHICPQI
jgi:hypothetical protein